MASVSSIGPGKWYFDYSTGKVYVGTDPSNHVTEISALRAAFQGAASNVTISHLTIEKYASIAGSGAVQALSPTGAPSSGWIIDSDDIRLNDGMGIRVSNGMIVKNSKIHDNGQLGLGGSGKGILVTDNEIFNNNYAGYRWGWEAGGAKFTFSTNLTVSDNYAHDNAGPGLWTDINNDYVLYENNHTARNIEAGILHEISFHATIKDNLIEDDGFGSPSGTSIWFGGGILISDSSDVTVYGNTVTDCMNGIGGIYTYRTGPNGVVYYLKNLNVHDNTVTQQVNYAAGIVRSGSDNAVYTSWGNRYHDNKYSLYFPAHLYFTWMGQSLTFDQWQAFGLD